MTLNPNWPLLACQVAFNAGINTVSVTPTWTDLAPRLWTLGCDRGRQYELDQNETGTGQIVFADKDEILNPANPSSPFAGNVLPYRPISVQAMWPPAPVGGAVNLLNAQAGNGINPLLGPYDTSFESYAAGVHPAWVVDTGITSTVGTTTPFQGTKQLSWNVTVSSNQQSIGVNFAALPGRYYLVSAYVRQTAANTMFLAMNGHPDLATSTTTATWLRLSGVVWADQPQMELLIGNHTAANSGTMLVDAIQVEPVFPLNSTSDFSQGLGGYTSVNNATLRQSSTVASYHTASLEVDPDGVTANPKAQSPMFAVQPNTAYALHSALSAAAPVSRLATVWWYDSGQVLISANSITFNPLLGWKVADPALAVTSPANAAFAQVGTEATGTAPVSWNADHVDLVPATPSTFTTSGPGVYGIHRGFVERWPSTWKHDGLYGYAQVDTVDAFAALAARRLHTEYRNAVTAKAPAYYWTLSEPAGAATFGEVSGNKGPAMTIWPLASAFTAGVQTSIAGDPSGVGVTAPGTPSALTSGQKQPLNITLSGSSWGFTAAFWLSYTTLPTYGQALLISTPVAPGATAGVQPGLILFIPNTSAGWFINIGSNTAQSGTPGSGSTKVFNDGKPHLFVVTASLAAGTITLTLTVDNVVATTGTVSATTVFGSTTPSISWTTAELGGQADVTGANPGVPGTFSHLALWTRSLASGELTDLSNAGKGYPGESSGPRIARYLQGNYNGATAIDTGQSTMGVSDLADGTVLLDACLAVALTENGNFWADSYGTLTFASRTRRYFTTTAQYVFGENQAGGEAPYEDDIAYDYDPTQIYNDVTVANSGGATAEVQDTTSQANYGPRSYQRDINVQSDLEAVDASTWLLATHKDPHQRIAVLTIKPSHNPALWPVALGAEWGGGVGGRPPTIAGFTMQADYFIEQVSHSQSDEEWTVQFQMSPAFQTPAGVLDNATMGQLGTDGMVLVNAIGTADTTCTVASTTGNDLFTTAASLMVLIDREVITVNSVASIGSDAYTRTTANGWGTPVAGPAYVIDAGTVSEFACNGSQGTMVLSTASATHTIRLPFGLRDYDLRIDEDNSATPVGGDQVVFYDLRETTTLDFYRVYVRWKAATNTATIQLSRSTTSGGEVKLTETQIPNAVNSTGLTVHAQVFGGTPTTFRAKAWPTGATEPPTWTVTNTYVDGLGVSTGDLRIASFRDTGSTNAVTILFDNLIVQPQVLTIARPTDGSAATHGAGAVVQVYQPFVITY